MKYRYQCIASKQSKADKLLVQFAARATEIDVWAGIPQKKKFAVGGQTVGETVGFQREENETRVNSLRDFYHNPENVIQNPLLCSVRDIPESSVSFNPTTDDSSDSDIQLGELVIVVADFATFSFEKCVSYVRAYIEDRVPDLKSREPDGEDVNALKALAADIGYVPTRDAPEESEDDSLAGTRDELSENGDPTGVLFEESHILDFWQDIAALHEVVKSVNLPSDIDEFLGYTRDALLSYLRPIVLVDGQHRLRGALAAAQQQWNDENIQTEVEERITAGDRREDVEVDILNREARILPVSLLMSKDPEEQVFQFVVVNQKATPIGRALLGTIVSTTLSNDEIGNVAMRLKDAGIEVEESQAITYLARHPDSPFCDLVERGLAGDTKDVLKWNVFASLIAIFRTLRGGKLFGERNDYAELWKNKFLNRSKIVSTYESHGCKSAEEYWRRIDGPWRDVFIRFWTEIRDTFANIEDFDRHNYWGRPRQSNLFNKVSLTILAADFFQFLVESRTKIDSPDEIPGIVEEWLENVSDGYFDKDWLLSGVKKDSVGIRNQWASLWTDYRKAGGYLPDRRLFSRLKGA